MSLGGNAFPSRPRSSRMLRRGRFAFAAGVLLGLAAAACAPQARTWDEVKRSVRESFPEVDQVSTETVAAWLRQPEGERPLLLDVREADEYAVSHLAGARRARDLDQALAALEGEPKDRRIVAYCSVGWRSSELARELAREGYTNVHDMEGSIFAWANEGRPVVRGDEAVRQVHPYDEDWGRLLDAGLWAFEPRPPAGASGK